MSDNPRRQNGCLTGLSGDMVGQDLWQYGIDSATESSFVFRGISLFYWSWIVEVLSCNKACNRMQEKGFRHETPHAVGPCRLSVRSQCKRPTPW